MALVLYDRTHPAHRPGGATHLSRCHDEGRLHFTVVSDARTNQSRQTTHVGSYTRRLCAFWAPRQDMARISAKQRRTLARSARLATPGHTGAWG